MQSCTTQIKSTVTMSDDWLGLSERALSAEARTSTGSWIARLSRAIELSLFVLHYQPIVALDRGGVSHHEALVRLADRGDGVLTLPSRFLPAAERCGLIRQIDRNVIGQAIALMGLETTSRQSVIAVNVSAVSVVESETLAFIESVLDAHQVDPARLIVEVTETAAISDMRRARAFCRDVRLLGCAVALDDFGSGFGSFRYLKRLPFDYLKIDGDFIRSLRTSPHDQLVVEALVRVARGMGKRTVAEWVDGPKTADLLRQYGVDYAQGFGLGRPGAGLRAFALA